MLLVSIGLIKCTVNIILLTKRLIISNYVPGMFFHQGPRETIHRSVECFRRKPGGNDIEFL